MVALASYRNHCRARGPRDYRRNRGGAVALAFKISDQQLWSEAMINPSAQWILRRGAGF